METNKYNQLINDLRKGEINENLGLAVYFYSGGDADYVNEDNDVYSVLSDKILAVESNDIPLLGPTTNAITIGGDEDDFWLTYERLDNNYADTYYVYDDLTIAYCDDIRDMTIEELAAYLNYNGDGARGYYLDDLLQGRADMGCDMRDVMDVVSKTIIDNDWKDLRGSDSCSICSDGARILKIDSDNNMVTLIPA